MEAALSGIRPYSNCDVENFSSLEQLLCSLLFMGRRRSGGCFVLLLFFPHRCVCLAQIRLLCWRPRTAWRGGCSSCRVAPQTARPWCRSSAGTGANTWRASTGQVRPPNHPVPMFVSSSHASVGSQQFLRHRRLGGQCDSLKGGREGGGPGFQLPGLQNDPQQHAGPWGRRLPSPEPPRPG